MTLSLPYEVVFRRPDGTEYGHGRERTAGIAGEQVGYYLSHMPRGEQAIVRYRSGGRRITEYFVSLGKGRIDRVRRIEERDDTRPLPQRRAED